MCLFVRVLGHQSSAEDFFTVLDLPYDPAVIRVKRLHIMHRFGTYLNEIEGLDALPDDEARTLCRDALERAYRDFETTSPLQDRTFKVLKDAVAPLQDADAEPWRNPTFVPLSTIERVR